MKDSFVLLKEQRPAFDMLSDVEAGKLIKAVMAYSFDNIEPDLPPVLAMAFAMLKSVIDKHAAKYEATCRARSKAGAKGGIASGSSRRKQSEANKANEANASDGNMRSKSFSGEACEHECDCECDCECEEKRHTPLPPSPGGGACASPAPLSGEDIAEAQDAVRQEHRRGDYEFSLLRQAYDSARQEGPMAGRQEFLRLFGSPEWPGIDELVHAVDVLCAEDDQFRRGYAPGLARFLADRMWRMRPRAPAGEKAPTQEDEDGKRKWEALKAKVRADKEARKKRGR